MYAMRGSGELLRGLEVFVSLLSPECVMAEVGCYAGESTKVFLRKAAHIYAVDPWQPYREDAGAGVFTMVRMDDAEAAFDAFVSDSDGRVTKIAKPSLEAVGAFQDGSLDLVYLDGDHSYEAVCADILAWMPKVKPGGVLAGHDFSNLRPAVIQGVLDTIGMPDAVFVDSTWMCRMAA